MKSTNAAGWTIAPPAYDAAGDVTNDGRNAYLYDAEGRICAANYIGYLYDAAGNRVAKGTITSWSCDMTTNGFVQTAGYVVGPSGEQLTEVDANNNWVHTNAYAGGKLIGTYDAMGLHFHIDDPLGTRRAQVNSAGVLEAVYQSLPFGDGYAEAAASGVSDPTEQHFTGKERDTESGNDYFGARYFGSGVGRFTSPDDGTDQIPTNPQSWNLYSYVWNNPMTHTDSDGHSVNVCDNSGQCNIVSNDDYKAAQQSDSYNSAPSLDAVGSSGNGAGQFSPVAIFGDGGIVGSATYVSDGPTDYYANSAGLNQMIPAANVVNALGGLEVGIMAPWAAAAADCMSGGSKAGCAANMALAVVPAAGELRAGGKLLKAAEELTASEYISKYLKGGINRVFPGQFNGATIKDIQAAAAVGDRDARTALKLLTDGRFKK
jgi:RHS repeat-associated protein